MICKKCGKEIANDARFCTACGAPVAQEPLNNKPPVGQQPANGSVPPVGQQPANGSVPPVGQQPANGSVPPVGQQPANGNVPPVGQQPANGNVPPVGQQPANGNVPPVGQQPVNPVAGQPIPPQPNAVANTKKFNWKPLAFGGAALVVVAIVVVIIVKIISNTGVNGVLNNFEKAINNQDGDALEKCFPDFVLEDKDADDLFSEFGFSDSKYFDDVEIDFSLDDQEDVTDEDCDKSYSDESWAEYIENYYEDHFDDYDGESIEAVVQADADIDIDTGNSAANIFASALVDDASATFTFVKVDGDWYIFDLKMN